MKEILDTSLTDAQVENFIAIASAMVDDLDTDTTLTDARLILIEQWLTAHIIASTRERMGKSEKLGDAQITYLGEFGKGLDSTPYGQMAAQLDTSGTLRALGKKKITMKAITSFE